MEETTTVFVKEQGIITLLINKELLFKELMEVEQFIIVTKRQTIIKEPWEEGDKTLVTDIEIALNKDYIVLTF